MQYYLKSGRLIRGLGDRWLFKTPGLKQLVELVGAIPGEPGAARQLLNDGYLVGVSPGGTREAISGTENNYRLKWNKRTGFAKLAIETGVPIIPGFTRNVEELYRAPLAGSKILQGLYEATRIPLVPIIGLGILPFPVKLQTFFGEKIYARSSETAEDLAERVKKSIEELIRQNQPRKQTVVSALRERLKF
jgi:1-acyl-sn-glycerol-3-phosphate acyltransferase